MAIGVRVQLRWVDDPEDTPVIVDLHIDSLENRQVVSQWPMLGLSGSTMPQRDGVLWPFVLHRDGQIDWGYGLGEDRRNRFGRTDLLDGPIRAGRRVHIIDGDGDWLYEIRSVAQYGEPALD